MGKEPKSVNYQFAAQTSEGFYQTGIQLAKHIKKDNSKHGYVYIPPAVVNFSFATELLLKSLIFYDSGASKSGHKLLTLYNSLSDSSKKALQDKYDDYYAENEKNNELSAIKIKVTKNDNDANEEQTESNNFQSIEDLLKLHSESFENWRYLYEFGSEGYVYNFDFKAMDALHRALRDSLSYLLQDTGPTFGMNRV